MLVCRSLQLGQYICTMPSSKPFKVLYTAMVLLNGTRCSALIACLNVAYCILRQGTPHGVSFYAGVIGILSVRAACMRDAVVTVHCTVCRASVCLCLSVSLSVCLSVSLCLSLSLSVCLSLSLSLSIIIYLSEHCGCINLLFIRMQISKSQYLSVFLSVCLFLCLSLSLSLCFCICICRISV